jgi:hypothetical protein
MIKKGKVKPATFELSWGSGFCIATDRYVVTAHHILSGGKTRDPKDKFCAFVVPQNADQAFHFPVISFPVERADFDIAILELGLGASKGISIPGMPISFDQPPDGSRVMTVGFPAPQIEQVTITTQGDYQGGRFFLKSHANEGIVSAQYVTDGQPVYELNIGWSSILPARVARDSGIAANGLTQKNALRARLVDAQADAQYTPQ